MAKWALKDIPKPNPAVVVRNDDWEVPAKKLLAVYNQCVERANAKSTGLRAGLRRPTPLHLEIMFGLGLFCAEMKVDPSTWIVTIFEVRRYRFPPTAKLMFSMAWKKHYDSRFGRTFEDASNLELVQTPATKHRPFLDFYVATDVIRERYARMGRADLCMSSMDMTFGYHPESAHCGPCPRQTECAAATSKLAQGYGK